MELLWSSFADISFSAQFSWRMAFSHISLGGGVCTIGWEGLLGFCCSLGVSVCSLPSPTKFPEAVFPFGKEKPHPPAQELHQHLCLHKKSNRIIIEWEGTVRETSQLKDSPKLGRFSARCTRTSWGCTSCRSAEFALRGPFQSLGGQQRGFSHLKLPLPGLSACSDLAEVLQVGFPEGICPRHRAGVAGRGELLGRLPVGNLTGAAGPSLGCRYGV